MPPLKALAILVIFFGIASIMLQHRYWLPLSSKGKSTLYALQQSTVGVHRSEEFFLLNYEAMEKDLKVFVYPGGNPKTCYHSIDKKLKSNYASEHYFFMNLRNSSFLTENPDEAHLFFIPLSCQPIEDQDALPRYKELVIQNYVRALTIKYRYWNRTLGADHFFVSCHGIGNRATAAFPFLLKNAIRLVCSPSYDSNYIPHKDVSLPQILELSLPPEGDGMWNDSTMKSLPIQLSPEETHPPRTKLCFWAGYPSTEVRKNLRVHYKGLEEFEIHFVENAKRAFVLDKFQKEICRSKFCICPRGKTQVGGVCLAESMAFGCVPVIMSDYYDLPFNDILDWNAFSVILKEDDVPIMGEILKGIPEDTFENMRQNVLKVSKYFKWHFRPVKYDEFHMVMYELWKRRQVIRY
ncbi:PREDICTED: probable glycosyltransferase At3g07620 isoform X1 [Populus euphratica]|uniref:Probable glycosyltransferase At3g07620 isoform X1 n=1 Tax=Populus euphratica TaxID=75702 RepID=A0AAJ6X509_POPEU|nr:PREDICTED: probable glycosyltransferase At3g07620 isoform X1 [Populus euphratica]